MNNLNTTFKTVKILEIKLETINNCKFGESIQWGGVVSGSYKVQNLMSLWRYGYYHNSSVELSSLRLYFNDKFKIIITSLPQVILTYPEKYSYISIHITLTCECSFITWILLSSSVLTRSFFQWSRIAKNKFYTVYLED